MLEISRDFVERWASEYDRDYNGTHDACIEAEIKQWLDQLEQKHLDGAQFIKLARWKSPRPMRYYKDNTDDDVRRRTRYAFSIAANSEMDALRELRSLKGVGVKVAATMLHFAFPDKFPIFDSRACSTLREAGLWTRSVKASSPSAWKEYVQKMGSLAERLGVSLRELDKALYFYNKQQYRHKVGRTMKGCGDALAWLDASREGRSASLGAIAFSHRPPRKSER